MELQLSASAQVHTDDDICTKFHWTRPHALSSESRAEIMWTIPEGTPAGSYRSVSGSASTSACVSVSLCECRQSVARPQALHMTACSSCSGRTPGSYACDLGGASHAHAEWCMHAGCGTLGTTSGCWGARTPSMGPLHPSLWGRLQACGHDGPQRCAAGRCSADSDASLCKG